MSDYKKTIPLNYPIEVTDDKGVTTTIKEITIGRLKVKHLDALPPDFQDSDGQINLVTMAPVIAAMAGLSKAQMSEMDVVDLMSVGGGLQSFLPQSQATGGS